MDLVQFVLILMVIGFLMWVFHKYIPVTKETRRVLTIVLAVIIALWFANFFDMFDLEVWLEAYIAYFKISIFDQDSEIEYFFKLLKCDYLIF